jgi:hypothetical protein
MKFEDAKTVMELAGLFMIILPLFLMTILSIALYYKNKN